MNNLEKIEYLKELKNKEQQLMKELTQTSKEIENEKSSCQHISVDLGYYGQFPNTGDKYRCLICGKGNGYFYEPNYIVHAENYLTHLDIRKDTECDEKFDIIQTLTLNILKNNPDMNRKEIVDTLNNLIQENIMCQYNEEMDKLISLLNKIIKSNKYTSLTKNSEFENTLEYGFIGKETENLKFDNLNNKNFWEFIYEGICKIAPDAKVSFMNVDFAGNKHSTIIIELSDKVQAIILNNDHKYDEFISNLERIMKNEQDISDKENTYILTKKIKPLN